MHHDGGAQARLVGEHAALEAPGHSLGDDRPAHAAGSGLEVERALEDGREGGGHLADVHDDDDQGTNDEEHRHEGHDALVRRGDAPEAAQDHQRQEHDHHQRGDDIHHGGVGADQRVDALGNRGHLPHVADAEGGHDGEQGKQPRQDRTDDLAVLHGPDAVLEVVHRAAAPFALLIPAAEEDAQHVFGVIGHHAHDRGDPHPEDRARAAHGDGIGHAGDVARADRGGQGGAQRLELGDGMPVMALADALFVEQSADGIAPHVAEAGELEKPGQHRHEDARADEQHQGGHAPDDAVDRVVEGSNLFCQVVHGITILSEHKK